MSQSSKESQVMQSFFGHEKVDDVVKEQLTKEHQLGMMQHRIKKGFNAVNSLALLVTDLGNVTKQLEKVHASHTADCLELYHNGQISALQLASLISVR